MKPRHEFESGARFAGVVACIVGIFDRSADLLAFGIILVLFYTAWIVAFDPE